LWIGAGTGLFRLDGQNASPWDAKIQITNKLPSVIYNDTPIQIKWKYENTAWRTTPDLIRFQIAVKSKKGVRLYDVPERLLERTVEPLEPGDYVLSICAIDLNERRSIDTKIAEFTVHSSVQELILEYIEKTGAIYAFLNILIFITLVIGSRKSQRCF